MYLLDLGVEPVLKAVLGGELGEDGEGEGGGGVEGDGVGVEEVGGDGDPCDAFKDGDVDDDAGGVGGEELGEQAVLFVLGRELGVGGGGFGLLGDASSGGVCDPGRGDDGDGDGDEALDCGDPGKGG